MTPASTAPTTLNREELTLDAWRAFLFGHSRLLDELNEELQEKEGVTLGEFDVLANLATAPKRRLRMCDLANQVLLSPSGISRRVERLERAGLVRRERAASDARNVEAQLTPAGARLFRRLRRTHVAGIQAQFGDNFSAEELETLRDLLGRLLEDDA